MNSLFKKQIFSFIILIIFQQLVQGQVIVDRAKIAMQVIPQGSYTETITVYNRGDHPVHVRVYYNDFRYIPPFDGGKEFLPPETTEYSAAKWINFSPHEFELAPSQGKKVTVFIRVPEKIQGGYYGILFFETRPGTLQQSNIELAIVQRIGSLLFFEASNKQETARIDTLEGTEGGIQGVFHNTGNTILIPHGIFFIMDKEGMAVKRGELTRFYLPPQKDSTFRIPLAPSLPSGKYTVVLTFDMEDGDVLVQEIDFIKEGAAQVRVLGVK